jgi:hypothetical protein
MKIVVRASLWLVSAVSATIFAGAVLACNKQPEPIPRTDKPVASANDTTSSSALPNGHPPIGAGMGAPMGHGAASATDGEDVAYDAPSAWVSAPNPSPMRKATFKIPKAGGEPDDAELSISSASGGVDANVKRWEGQFGPDAKAKTEARTVHGLKVTVVELKGKLSGASMMGAPSAPKENQMLLGAVVELGDIQHFFKLVGGEKTVTAAKKDFDALVSSIRKK